jgi:hypothetical protein
MQIRVLGIVAIAWAAGILAAERTPFPLTAHAQAAQVPTFELDRSWPKALPNRWELGYVMAVAVDRRDHVFVLHTTQDDYGQPVVDKDRPNDSLIASGWYERIKKPGATAAPPVLEFDADGNFVRAWGGPGHGHPWTEPGPEKMWAEHSLNVDPKGNVWIVGGGHLALKFSPEGKFLLQIGELNKTNGSNDPRYLGDPASVDFYAPSNEIFIADGYKNKRIIVYDMDSGAFKRLWGSYGKKPVDDSEPSTLPVVLQATNFVHDVKVSTDGFVYGVNRHGTSIQQFRVDGRFVREVKSPPDLNGIALSTDPQQTYVYAGGRKVFILRRSDLKEIGSFESVGQHYLAVDSKGNLYTTGNSMPRKFVLRAAPRQ